MLSPSSEGPSSGVQQTEGQTEEPMKVFYGSDLHGALSLSHLPLATINGHHGASESSNEGLKPNVPANHSCPGITSFDHRKDDGDRDRQ